ncbi:hypothetical protein BGZ58_009042, partial [Dissophora ornata]
MSYSYPYTAHLLDKVGESSQSRPAIPQAIPTVEVETQSLCSNRVYDGSVAPALHGSQDDVDDEAEETDEQIALYTSENGWRYLTHHEQGDKDDDGAIQTSSKVQVEHQTQDQHQMLSISPSQIGPTSGSTSRKRKGKQSKELQPQVDSNDEATNLTARLGIGNGAPPLAVSRSDLEWARINNREEADAVFTAQQVGRANLHRTTLKSYDKYRNHWS